MTSSSFKNRNPKDIVTIQNFFEASGRVFKALSWLDFARHKQNISALEYAALETSLGIEQLFFEQLVVGVGTDMDAANYKKCSGNAKRLNELIEKLIPRYERLVDFINATHPQHPPINKWDNRLLIKYSLKISPYLHSSGWLNSSVHSIRWFKSAVTTIEEAANYLWQGLNSSNSAVVRADRLSPEISELWQLYSQNKISLAEAVERAVGKTPLHLEAHNTAAPTDHACQSALL